MNNNPLLPHRWSHHESGFQVVAGQTAMTVMTAPKGKKTRELFVFIWMMIHLNTFSALDQIIIQQNHRHKCGNKFDRLHKFGRRHSISLFITRKIIKVVDHLKNCMWIKRPKFTWKFSVPTTITTKFGDFFILPEMANKFEEIESIDSVEFSPRPEPESIEFSEDDSKHQKLRKLVRQRPRYLPLMLESE
jgi:hypothetical protein